MSNYNTQGGSPAQKQWPSSYHLPMRKQPPSQALNTFYKNSNKTYIWSKLLRYMDAAKPLVAEINQYLTRLNTEQQKAVLTVAKTFAATQEDWWDEINTEQQAIDNALAE